ncbi:hypothetical protein B0920_02080 [Massilia sp. KIM]|nr:hypothetical protein B0920_02080 [Massilia sp. KIM]
MKDHAHTALWLFLGMRLCMLLSLAVYALARWPGLPRGRRRQSSAPDPASSTEPAEQVTATKAP